MSALLFARRSALVPSYTSTAASKRLMSSRSVYNDTCPLVLSPRQLHDIQKSRVDVKFAVLDASWHMPTSPRIAKEEFLKKHIVGAHYLDLDEVASPHELGLKHMMPTKEVFAKECERLGISWDTHVIIYDTHGVFSSPRALFMFRAFGHKHSSILDGGLPNWEAYGFKTVPGERKCKSLERGTYQPPDFDADTIRSYEQMTTNAAFEPSATETELVLDARPRGRYLGTEPEPRPGLPSGHIPHSRSLPFTAFLETNTYKPSSDSDPVTFTTLASSERMIAALEESLGTEYAKDVLAGKRGVVTTCGSGMTAAVIWLGLQMLGVRRIGLYDESWTGYATRSGSPIVKGE